MGEGVLLECLDNPGIEKVLSVSRRPCGHFHPKLEEYLVEDFMQLEAGDEKLRGYDAVFFCAGISSIGMKEEQYKVISHDIPLKFAQIVDPKEKMTFKGAYNFRPAIMWRYKGQKHIQKMQYAFWALYPLIKFFGYWNTMSEVGRAMIAVSRKGYPVHEIEVKDISKLAKSL